jgi:hypothetical protein
MRELKGYPIWEATVIVKKKETEKELAKEIKGKRGEGTSWFVPKKKKKNKELRLIPLCRTRLEKGMRKK